MRTTRMRFTAVIAAALLLAGCTAGSPDSAATNEPTAAATSATPTAAPQEPAADGSCPPALVESISAEVAPTAVREEPDAQALPESIVFDEAPTCILSYSVLSGGAFQIFYVGATEATWQAFQDSLASADGFGDPAETYGAVGDGIAGASWNREGNSDRATETTLITAGWVSGPDVADAPPDAAVLGTSYLVVTVEDCPCE